MSMYNAVLNQDPIIQLVNTVRCFADDMSLAKRMGYKVSQEEKLNDHRKLVELSRNLLMDGNRLNLPMVEKLESHGYTVTHYRDKGRLAIYTPSGHLDFPISIQETSHEPA